MPRCVAVSQSIPERPPTNENTRRTQARTESLPKYTHVAAANATTPPSRDTFCSSFSAMIPFSLRLAQAPGGGVGELSAAASCCCGEQIASSNYENRQHLDLRGCVDSEEV